MAQLFVKRAPPVEESAIELSVLSFLDSSGEDNSTAERCFHAHSRSSVLQGLPFGGVPTVLAINVVIWMVWSSSVCLNGFLLFWCCFLSSFLRGLVINSTLLQKLQKLQKICLNDSLLASFDVVSEMVVVNLLTNIYFNFWAFFLIFRYLTFLAVTLFWVFFFPKVQLPVTSKPIIWLH